MGGRWGCGPVGLSGSEARMSWGYEFLVPAPWRNPRLIGADAVDYDGGDCVYLT